MKMRTIKELKNLSGKKVFVTVDFNISLKDGKISNDKRIIEALPTLKYLLDKNGKLILASHLGRPKGIDMHFSLKPVAKRLQELIGKKVILINNFWEKNVNTKIGQTKSDEIVLLENIRFYPGEEKNDIEFSRHLASMADLFVNDAFGTSHRVHSSIVGITQFLPSYAGLLLSREVEMLSNALEKPKRPFLLIIGGAKTPEKISVIEKLLDKADTIVLGGAIANTFLAAWGFGMGQSMVDYEMIEMSRVVFWKATKKHCALILPTDVIISDKDRKAPPKIAAYNKVPPHVVIYDIGPKTQNHYKELINKAKTIIWNGPMGLYEDSRFSKGTDNLLKYIVQSKAFSIVGGGDTLTSINSQKYFSQIDHISTGGSAMLEYLEKSTLSGVEVLKRS